MVVENSLESWLLKPLNDLFLSIEWRVTREPGEFLERHDRVKSLLATMKEIQRGRRPASVLNSDTRSNSESEHNTDSGKDFEA